MAYEMVMPYHLHMPSYFLETFTEYPNLNPENTTEMNPFIILLVQNATKCIFHTQES